MLSRSCKSIGCTGETYSADKDFCTDCESDFPATYVKEPIQQCLDMEHDPEGRDLHQAGAKADHGKVRMHLITGGMARAITEVAKIGTFGAAKYTDNGWIAVPDGFRRYEDAQQRHAAKRHMGETNDSDSGLLHLAHEAWNCLAKLDLYIREQEDHTHH